MKKICLLLLLNLFITSAFAQEYARIKVFFDDQHTPAKLAALGLETDHGYHHADEYIINDFSSQEIAKIKNEGYRTTVLVQDVQQHYATQNQQATTQNRTLQQVSNFCDEQQYFELPQNFALGSMGGYLTYNEMLQNLDSMAAKYPNLVKPRTNISNTLRTSENRALVWFKISDNPNQDENEPEILYSALHHAREPLSMSQLIYLAWYCLENYQTNPDIKFLLDNTELYFVPCVNPDGYIYNQNNNPQGGGMWRKNRRLNADGTYGVDLNRNYGFNWGIDNLGSSPDPSSDLYRGTAGFSEPETQLMRLFCNQHQFKIALNAHSYGNLLIYPWGYNNGATNDSTTFRNLSRTATEHNRSRCGTAIETVQYNVNGTSDDWMYGEQVTKPKILAMTPESAAYYQGFYPPAADIISLCQEYMLQNIRCALSLHNYGTLKPNSPKNINRQTASSNLSFLYQNLGINNNAATNISVLPLTMGASSQSVLGGNVAAFSQTTTNTNINNNFANCENLLNFETSINTNAGYVFKDTVAKYYYDTDTVLFADSFLNGNNWILEPDWAVQQNLYYNAPSTNYPTAEMKFQVPLTPGQNSRFYVQFKAKWQFERGDENYVQVFAKTGTSLLEPLCLTGSVPANVYQNGFSPLFSPVFDGKQATYATQEADISHLAGNDISLVFQIYNNTTSPMPNDGIVIDDVKIVRTSSNCPNVGSVEVQNLEKTIFLACQQGLQPIKYSSRAPQSNFVLYDLLGKKVFEKTVTTQDIVTPNLPKGIYLAEINGTKMKVLVW